MIGHCCVVDFANPSFLGSDTAGEVAQVVNCQWNVCGQGFAYGFAIVPSFRHRKRFQMGFHAVGNFQQNPGPVCH